MWAELRKTSRLQRCLLVFHNRKLLQPLGLKEEEGLPEPRETHRVEGSHCNRSWGLWQRKALFPGIWTGTEQSRKHPDPSACLPASSVLPLPGGQGACGHRAAPQGESRVDRECRRDYLTVRTHQRAKKSDLKLRSFGVAL